MTYKMGMRAAAVLAIDGASEAESVAVMQQVKRLYDWRSAIVHGDDADKPRQKFVGENAASGVTVASALVRRVLQLLAAHPELRADGAIDTKRLLAAPADF